MNLRTMRTLFETATALIGIMLLAGAGGTAYAATGSEWMTAAAMLATAAGIATKGREWAQHCWERIALGEADPYGEATRHYKRTSRSKTLAPKLAHLMRRATKDVRIVVVGTEPDGVEGRSTKWDEALEDAARAGAEITVFAMPDDPAGCQRSEALAARHANVECIVTERAPNVWCVLQPVIAWSGERDDPEQALLWLEGVADEDETWVDAEYRGTSNLRRNTGMLGDFEDSTQAARPWPKRTTRTLQGQAENEDGGRHR